MHLIPSAIALTPSPSREICSFPQPNFLYILFDLFLPCLFWPSSLSWSIHFKHHCLLQNALIIPPNRMSIPSYSIPTTTTLWLLGETLATGLEFFAFFFSMLVTSTATMLTGAIIITIQMVNAWLAGPVPTTSPCYIAPRRPPVSTLAAGKQTPTQILHLPVSIWTVAYLTDVS